MRKARTWVGIATGVLAFTLIAAACSSNNDNSGSSGSSGASGGDLTGSLNISGSSTVEPISSLVAENFQSANTGVNAAVDGPGTTDGFVTFCQGQTDINDASRVISDDEKKACSDGGVHYVELAIGRDALTVVGNPGQPRRLPLLGGPLRVVQHGGQGLHELVRRERARQGARREG